ncbi:MAG: Oxidoreductase, NAD-binding domain protein [candidate division TM6 bacterium GW2011_GWF2_32_72]|nr:MAG: Oxidoreductase, NAD-binding domain protein [candidate division TM6 bacterium GW2011_GWF2_32_72]
MRQVFLDKGLTSVKEVCEPALNDNSVLVSVHYSFVSSGSELTTISASGKNFISDVPQKIKSVMESISLGGSFRTKSVIKNKLADELSVIGYSCSGCVIAVGKKVKKFRPGDYVACAGAGFANHADIVCVPENLVVRVALQENLRAASLTTLGTIALHGIRRARVELGEVVAVVGLGLIGQLTVQLAKLSGCKVIGIDIDDARTALAKEMGADVVYNALTDDVEKDISFLTHRYGVDCTVITAASLGEIVIQQAVEITRKKGRVVVVGDVDLKFDRNPFYQKEIDFLVSFSYGPGRYDKEYEQGNKDYPYAFVRWTENRNMQAFVNLIEAGSLNLEHIVSDEISVDRVCDAYELLKNKKRLGLILSFLPKDDNQFLPARTNETLDLADFKFVPAIKDKNIRLGVIGAGGSEKIDLLSIMSKVGNLKIDAIVDTDVARSLNTCKFFGAKKCFIQEDALFEEDNVDAVLIASEHKFHCDQAIKALSKGKAVYLEKPMVTDFEQFDRLTAFLAKNPGVSFCVGYSRSFAPFIQKIKKAVEGRRTPLIASYRVNSGLTNEECWAQAEKGAGKIIGEACHFIDLFCFLTDSEPVAVSVESLKPSGDDLFPTDNYSAQISFADGSICTLIFTSLGHKSMGEERLELFFDSKSIVMEDYKSLQGFGLPRFFNEIAKEPDKGHEELVKRFFKGLKASRFVSPIGVHRLNKVAKLTLVIDSLACRGGGSKEFNL